MTNWITCGRCPNRWTGLRTAHCSVCHVTFTGPHAFDKHRKDGECRIPEKVGLVAHDRGGEDYKYVAWGEPSDDEAAKRFAAYREQRAKELGVDQEDLVEVVHVELLPAPLGDQVDTYVETGDWLERERPIRKEE